MGARRRRALGPRCGAACAVPARPAAGQHVAGGLGSRAGGRGDGGGGTAAVRRSAAARRRRQRRHRPRRPVRRVPPAPARGRGRVRRADAARRLGGGDRRGRRQPDGRPRPGRRGSASSSAACSRTSSPRARPPARSRRRALALPEIRALLADRLRGRPTRASFRTGHLTICTLVPMRSVPHRVVCLMGLDDGVFPRQTARDGDDLLLLDPHVGDRDARSEDRQLLLDAVLAATDHLVITYAARDERTNLRRPPAVPLGELLDVVDRTARFPDGGDDARAGGRRAPAAAVRPAQLRRGRARARADVELRPRRARRCAGAGGRPDRRAAVPRRAAAARARSP